MNKYILLITYSFAILAVSFAKYSNYDKDIKQILPNKHYFYDTKEEIKFNLPNQHFFYGDDEEEEEESDKWINDMKNDYKFYDKPQFEEKKEDNPSTLLLKYDEECNKNNKELCIKQYKTSVQLLQNIHDFYTEKNLHDIVNYLTHLIRSKVQINNEGANTILNILNKIIASRTMNPDGYQLYKRILMYTNEILYRTENTKYFDALVHCIFNFNKLFIVKFNTHCDLILTILDIYKVLFNKTYNHVFIKQANELLNKYKYLQGLCNYIDQNFKTICIGDYQMYNMYNITVDDTVLPNLIPSYKFYDFCLNNGINLVLFTDNMKYEDSIRKLIPNKMFYDDKFEYYNKNLYINLCNFEQKLEDYMIQLINYIPQQYNKNSYSIEDNYMHLICSDKDLYKNYKNICNYSEFST